MKVLRNPVLMLCGVLLWHLSGCGAAPEHLEECGFVPPATDSPTLPSSESPGLGVLRSAMACGPGSAQEPPARTFSKPIEGYASYVGQSTCSASAKPGVSAFVNLILKTYPCTGTYGIVRACNVGGTSEHKEGRAWDWKLNYPHPAADALIQWLLATDAQGNKHAMIRRIGIMYMIWNRKIWKSYQASKGWQAYTGSNPHTDHVHFSFSWDGANQKTSFWSGETKPTIVLDAKFTGQGSKDTYPASAGAYFSVCPGQKFQFHFSLQNTGNVDWKDVNQTTHGNAVRLGFKQGEQLGNPTRISINQASSSVVKPGQSVTFNMNATAPSKTGVFRTEWQLVSEMVAWFGPAVWQSFHVTEQPPGAGQSCSTGKPGECGAGVMTCSNGKLACVAKNQASPEICDGKDNDCNGQTDENNPGGGAPCQTSQYGLCLEGVMTCVQGKLTCVSKHKPSAEICDGKDNDCNGYVDDNGACDGKQEPPPVQPNEPPNPAGESTSPESIDASSSGPEPSASRDDQSQLLDDQIPRTSGGGVLVLDGGGTLQLPPTTKGCGCTISTPSPTPGSVVWCLLLLLGLLWPRFRQLL